MKVGVFLILILGLFNSGISNCYATGRQETIVFMRHGEKPVYNLICSHGQLTCQGQKRALALPQVMQGLFGKPDFIFAPNPAIKILDGCLELNSYVRPLATIAPTAIQYNLPINTPFGYHQFKAMADLLLSAPYRSSTIFVTWEHVNIYLMVRTIIKKLGGNPSIVPFWRNKDYDSLYVLTIDWNANNEMVKFRLEKEGLLDKNIECQNSKKTKKNRAKSPITTVFIIPSAESNGFGQLNRRGLNRSLKLKQVLASTNPKIGLDIDYFFAGAPNQKLSTIPYNQRSIMTLEPAAISQNKPLWILFDQNNSESMATHIAKKMYQFSTIAIAWDPIKIPRLASLIYSQSGGKISDIPSDVPDTNTIYKITFAKGRVPSFQKFSENPETIKKS